ncbi:ArnT family glycosyltransferase [Sunxiuqinia sp. A32]|uniref:ArnT family glycosyltransferase n=1 Tax=Sunxiuqinia sp. A32 TaxID=3461496 RepID=UPI0040461772
MIRRLSSNRYISVFLFLFAFVIYLSNIGGVSIYILDEAKNVECAREMLNKKDFIVPTFNEVLRTDKPPLHYYFMMLGFTIFGENAFGARFFSSLFGALTILITYLFVKKYVDKETSIWAAIILLASIHLSIQFHLAVPDTYLVFFLTSAIMSFYVAVKERKTYLLYAMYASIGFGVLAKGPVAIGLPGLIFLLFLIFAKRFKWTELKRLKPIVGTLIVLAIAIPWYVLVAMKTNGEWVSDFFLKHNLSRFSDPMEGHGGIFLITFAYVLVGLFPFSVFIFQAIRKAWKNRQNEFVLFSLIAPSVIVLFFSISSTKLPNYTVPSYPYFGILLAIYLKEVKLGKLKPGLIALMVIGLILIPAIFVGLKFDTALASVNSIAWYFLPLPLLLVLAYYFNQQKMKEKALIAVAGSGILTSLIFFLFAFPVIDRQNPVIKGQSMLMGKELRYFEKLNPAFPFALKKGVSPIDHQNFLHFFNHHPDGIIISTKKKIEKIDLPEELEVSYSSKDIFESPTTVYITKKGY